MCRERAARPPAKYRDESLRSQAAALRAAGLSLAQIGTRLGVHPSTVMLMLRPPPPLAEPETRPRVCRCCGRGTVNRPRGLCWSCYYSPGVRDKYPSTSRYARRGVNNRNGVLPLPAPTAALAGSEAKIEALTDRAARGVQLWHPADGGEW